MGANTPYSCRWEGPTLVPKDKAHTCEVSIEHGGAVPTVASVKFSMFDQSGVVLIDSAVAAESGGVLSYTIPALTTQDQDLGIGYQVRFEVTIAGYEHLMSNNAAVVSQPIYPSVGVTDLTNRYTKLAALMTNGTSAELQKYITMAYQELLIQMYSGGLRFWTIRSPGHLREWILTRALSLALADLALVINGSGYRDESRRLNRMLPGMYERIRSVLDVAEDNSAGSIQTPVSGVIQLSTSRGILGGT